MNFTVSVFLLQTFYKKLDRITLWSNLKFWEKPIDFHSKPFHFPLKQSKIFYKFSLMVEKNNEDTTLFGFFRSFFFIFFLLIHETISKLFLSFLFKQSFLHHFVVVKGIKKVIIKRFVCIVRHFIVITSKMIKGHDKFPFNFFLFS